MLIIAMEMVLKQARLEWLSLNDYAGASGTNFYQRGCFIFF